MKGCVAGKSLVISLFLLAVGTSVLHSQTPDPITEAAKLYEPDVYYWSGSSWQPMEPVTWTSSGVKKTGKASIWTYRHAEARIRFAAGQALFCYRTNGEAAAPDFIIARLDQKKDHRELQTPSQKGAFAFVAALSTEQTLGTTVKRVSSRVFVLSPTVPLAPGEYVLGGTSLAITGYDFSVRAER